MYMERNRKWGIAAGTALLASTLALSGNAFAVSPNGWFMSHYEANAQLETSLMQQAQAHMPSQPGPVILQLQTAVNGIQGQVATLYTSEQALQAERASIPQVRPMPQQQPLLRAIMQERGVLKGRVSKDNRQRIERRIRYLLHELQVLIHRLDAQSHAGFNWQRFPYHYGLGNLQMSVLNLQQSAIHYTREWIALEAAGSTVTGTVYGSGHSSSG